MIKAKAAESCNSEIASIDYAEKRGGSSYSENNIRYRQLQQTKLFHKLTWFDRFCCNLKLRSLEWLCQNKTQLIFGLKIGPSPLRLKYVKRFVIYYTILLNTHLQFTHWYTIYKSNTWMLHVYKINRTWISQQ